MDYSCCLIEFVSSKRSHKAYKNIDKALSAPKALRPIIIYAEGKRSPDGNIHRFKRGFIHIQKKSGFDLLPVTMNGFYRLKSMKRFYLDPSADLEIIFHPPVRNAALQHLTDEEIIKHTKDIIQADCWM